LEELLSPHLMIDIPDNQGLICAFRLGKTQSGHSLMWEAAKTEFADPTAPIWLHFNLADRRARNWLADCQQLSELARETLLANHSPIRLEIERDHIICVLGDFHYEFATDPEGLGILQLYLEPNRLITGRQHSLKVIDQLRRDFLNGGDLPSNPLQVVLQLLEHLTNELDNAVNRCGDIVDDIEEGILKGRYADRGSDLGQVRRLLVRLRRHMGGNRLALLRLLNQCPKWVSEIDKAELRREIERLDAVLQDLELVQERARLVQEEITSQLNEKINRNLYFLSIVTTVFLPVTLITGVFGMNVNGIPLTEDHNGFIWVTLVMGLTLGGTVIFLRRQRFI
jgi:zinc transporter